MAYRATDRTEQRKSERRARILAAARNLFAGRGYHSTTVPAIVEAADISTGNFYQYFRSKEDIFAAVLLDFAQRLSTSLNSAVGAESSIEGQMRAAVTQFVVFLAENTAEARILIVETAGLGGELESTRRDIMRSHTAGVETAIRALFPKRGHEAPTLARCWVGAVYESVYHWLEQPPAERMAPSQLAHVVAEFALRGIGAG